MKKYIVSLMILFVMQSCVAMELAKLSSDEDEKCFRVARYLHKYPEGKNQDEKNKIDLFFSSEKKYGLLSYASYLLFDNRENKDFKQTIDNYRNKIKNKDLFLLVAVCKELPCDVQKSIFDIIHQYMKKNFIDKTITVFERSFEKESEFLTANINLANDFKGGMRDDLLTLSKKPQDKKLTLSCSLYVDHPQWNPIQAIDCTNIIGLFNKREQEYQKILSMLSSAKEDADIVKLYIQFMRYLSFEEFFSRMYCRKNSNKMNLSSIYTMETNTIIG